jgi:hypothetical protein
MAQRLGDDIELRRMMCRRLEIWRWVLYALRHLRLLSNNVGPLKRLSCNQIRSDQLQALLFRLFVYTNAVGKITRRKVRKQPGFRHQLLNQPYG